MDFAEQLLKDNDYARGLRAPWESLWQDVCDYNAPDIADFSVKRGPGEKRGEKIVDTIGVDSSQELARHLDGFLTPDGFRWLYLRVPDKRTNENPAVRQWLDQVTDAMMYAFNAPQTGFGAAKEQLYDQLVVVGTAPMYVGTGPRGLPEFKSVHLAEVAVCWDDMGRPLEWYRQYDDTIFEIAKKFGRGKLPSDLLDILDKEPTRKFQCVHAIRPRREGDPTLFNDRHTFIEGYVLTEKRLLLAEPRGYANFPAVVPRWKVSPGESYGRSPAMSALPDVKGLQQVDVDTMKLIHKHVDPNYLFASGDGTTQPRVNQRPGMPWFADQNPQGHWGIQPIFNPARADEAFEYSNRKYARVERLFFLHAFRLVEKITSGGSVVHMSATEFAGRQAEQMRVAGPLVSRQRHEFLHALVNRVGMILMQGGWVPPPPPQLRGAPVLAEYVSPLAVAQRSQEANSILQWLADLSPLAAIDPRILDIANYERVGRGLGMYRQVPQFAFNSPEELATIQKSRADAAAQQQQAEQAQLLASASKDAAQAQAIAQGGI